MAGQLKITLKRSTIGRVPKHQRTIKALGLRKVGRSVIHQDTPQIRGMIRQVDFMIEVEEV
ncbi:MAG: 50S ribosomal protein L30 [bacterium]